MLDYFALVIEIRKMVPGKLTGIGHETFQPLRSHLRHLPLHIGSKGAPDQSSTTIAPILANGPLDSIDYIIRDLPRNSPGPWRLSHAAWIDLDHGVAVGHELIRVEGRIALEHSLMCPGLKLILLVGDDELCVSCG